MNNITTTNLLMLPQPKYQTLTDYQLYQKARGLLFAQMTGNRFSRHNADLINRECKRRNYKIWMDAFSDALISSELLRRKFDPFQSLDYSYESKITKIERVDYMEESELEKFIDKYSENESDGISSKKGYAKDFLHLMKYLKKRDTFVCRHKTDLSEELIPGAYNMVLATKTASLNNGDVVISIINKDLILKRFEKSIECCYLVRLDESAKTPVNTDDLELVIWGKVEGFIGNQKDI